LPRLLGYSADDVERGLVRWDELTPPEFADADSFATNPHPSLESVLKRTLGVPLFQEQLLRIAMTVANLSGAEAEELRRAVGMGRSWERMKTLEVKLRAGMTANGLDEKTQDKIVENIS